MTQAKIRIMPGRRHGITSCPMYTMEQDTAATFKHGAPVKLHANGDVVAASATASTSINYIAKASNNFYGFAAGKAVASSTGDIGVHLAQEGTTWVGNLLLAASSASSAVATQANVGDAIYLANISSEDHFGFTLTAPTSSAASYVSGYLLELVDAASTVNGRVMVEITTGAALD